MLLSCLPGHILTRQLKNCFASIGFFGSQHGWPIRSGLLNFQGWGIVQVDTSKGNPNIRPPGPRPTPLTGGCFFRWGWKLLIRRLEALKLGWVKTSKTHNLDRDEKLPCLFGCMLILVLFGSSLPPIPQSIEVIEIGPLFFGPEKVQPFWKHSE